MLLRFFLLLQEFYHDLVTQKTRAFLTTFAVAWGTLSVILLLAFGDGLEHQMINGQLNNGDRIIRCFGGNTSIVYRGLPKGRRIRLTPEDGDLLAASIPEIDAVSPAYGTRVPVEFGEKTTTSGYTVGVNPAFESLRRMFPTAGGRFLNQQDIDLKRRVVVLGSEISATLFGEEAPIGRQVLIGGNPFVVCGVLQRKFQNSMSNGPDNRRVVIPYTTFLSIWPRRGVWYLAVKPLDPAAHMQIRARITEVLGNKYGFALDDERAVTYWDAIEDEAEMRMIFGAIQIFLGAVGGMTLLIAGVGVANIMYVVVKERTREIGIKRAVGARRGHITSQFVVESLLVTGIGGAIGAACAGLILFVVGLLPLAENPSTEFIGTPSFSAEIAAFTIGVLVLIGLIAGIFPARRAARIEPVAALRYE